MNVTQQCVATMQKSWNNVLMEFNFFFSHLVGDFFLFFFWLVFGCCFGFLGVLFWFSSDCCVYIALKKKMKKIYSDRIKSSNSIPASWCKCCHRECLRFYNYSPELLSELIWLFSINKHHIYHVCGSRARFRYNDSNVVLFCRIFFCHCFACCCFFVMRQSSKFTQMLCDKEIFAENKKSSI